MREQKDDPTLDPRIERLRGDARVRVAERAAIIHANESGVTWAEADRRALDLEFPSKQLNPSSGQGSTPRRDEP